MGLRCNIRLEDRGYPPATGILGITIDYSEGLQAFVSTFLDIAQTDVPVDTGNLLRSIDASTDSNSSVSCHADAEYAQYVEYGTYKMPAQPYFRPALEEAWAEAAPLFDQAYEAALQEERELMQGSRAFDVEIT